MTNWAWSQPIRGLPTAAISTSINLCDKTLSKFNRSVAVVVVAVVNDELNHTIPPSPPLQPPLNIPLYR